MLTKLRSWFQHQFSPQGKATVDLDRATVSKTRQERSDIIDSLHVDIRGLQHNIADLSNTLDKVPAGGDRKQGDLDMRGLHQQLAQKQLELSKYQARI